MLTEYDHGGDSDVLVEKYDSIINTKFHRNYQGGITGFIDDYETAFTELTSLGEGYSERYKMKVLMRNLHLPDETDWLVKRCETLHPKQFTQASLDEPVGFIR